MNSTLQPVERGADFQVWQRIQTLRDAGGNTLLVTNPAFVELQTGMHYREDGVWKESREIIEAVPGGAMARYGGHKVIFAESSGSPVVVDLETPDGQRLQSRVLGLSYADASGKSVVFAASANVPGQIVNANQVIYPDAFSNVKADVRYTYTKAGLEQDVILREQPPTPESFGLDAKTTRLQVLTEFVDAPAPGIATRKLGADADSFEDQTLDFGVMQMAAGRAFLLGDSSGPEPTVGKRWAVVAGRTILTEEVAVARVAKQLETLPAKKRTAFFWKKSPKATVTAKLNLPVRKTAKPAKRAMQMAKLEVSARGLVLDYVLLAGQANFTFKGDTTYYVTALVNLSGTTTIEGGTVVKYTNSALAKIILNGPVVCQTGPYRPAIFTAKDDNSVGDLISGSTGNPGGNYYGGGVALTLASGAGPSASLTDLRFRYLRTSLSSQMSAAAALGVRHCQFVNCQTGISLANNNRLNLQNSLFANVGTAINDSSYVNYTFVDAQQVTFDQVTSLASRYAPPGYLLNLNLTNCVVAAVSQLAPAGQTSVGWAGDHNGFYPSAGPQFGLNPIPTDTNPFQGLGGGGHYLAAGAEFRASGTANIDATLLAELRNKTTQPPQEITSDIPGPQTWGQVSARDTSSTPDLGYHYDPLDYLVGGRTITGTLTLAGGVAVGIHGPYGFSGGVLVSTGTPTRRNHLGLYSAVQEQPVAAWGNASGSYFMNPAAATALNWQFTDLSLAGGALFGGETVNSIAMTDCSLLSVKMNLSSGYYLGHAFTNNVMDRCHFQYGSLSSPGYPVSFGNNLIRNSSLTFGFYGNDSFLGFVTIANNLFANDTFLYAVYPNYAPVIANNGFNNTTATSQGSLPITINSLDFQTGPRGPYYYPTSGGNLSQLLDTGSGTSASLGLDSYTTRLDQMLDADPVDIGFHYFPIDAPVATGGSALTCRNTPVNITLGGYDPNGLDLPLTYTAANPIHGQLTGTGQNRIYTPSPASYEGSDSFTYVVNNGYLSSASATVTIQVGGEPFAPGQLAMVGQWTAAHPLSATITLVGSDGCNDPLTYRITRQGDHGTATIVGNTANCTYTPTPNVTYVGPDDFEFVANDGNFDSAPATVSMNIAPGPVLDAQCRSSRIFLSWDITAIKLLFGSGYASGFKVYRGDSSGGPYSLLTPTKLAQNVGTFVDTTVLPGQDYFYVVTFVREEPDVFNPVTIYTYESQYSNEMQIQTCPLPPPEPIDVAFIIDNTGTMSPALTTLKNEIAVALGDIAAASDGNYRLALVTPDSDIVNVRVNFINSAQFETTLNSLPIIVGGINQPESTDECLNTVVNTLAGGRTTPPGYPCQPTHTLQFGDFTAFRPNAKRMVVLITDSPPTGFCDSAFFDPLIDGQRAHGFAQDAHNATPCIKINAILVTGQDLVDDARDVMQDYEATSCGWYSEVPGSGMGVAEAIVRMLYSSGACTCP